MVVDFDEWYIGFLRVGAPYSKEGFRAAFNAGVEFERTRCQYPDCLENEDGTCHRWMTEECPGPAALRKNR